MLQYMHDAYAPPALNQAITALVWQSYLIVTSNFLTSAIKSANPAGSGPDSSQQVNK